MCVLKMMVSWWKWRFSTAKEHFSRVVRWWKRRFSTAEECFSRAISWWKWGSHVFYPCFKNQMMIRSSHVMQSRMMRWWKWIMMETRVTRLNRITKQILFSNACFKSWRRKWRIWIHYRRYRSCTTWMTTSHQFISSPTHITHWCMLSF